MAVKFSESEIRLMLAHAEDEYPKECVGAVTGGGAGGKMEIIRLTNRQDKLHKSNPEKFARDGRTGYFVDPKEVFDLTRKVEEKGGKILAFYHSHPDHECYFSREDHDAATMWGEPVFPGADYIIISVVGGKAREAVIFSWDGKSFSPSAKLPVES